MLGSLAYGLVLRLYVRQPCVCGGRGVVGGVFGVS